MLQNSSHQLKLQEPEEALTPPVKAFVSPLWPDGANTAEVGERSSFLLLLLFSFFSFFSSAGSIQTDGWLQASGARGSCSTTSQPALAVAPD